mgnify:CR=1 FL=1
MAIRRVVTAHDADGKAVVAMVEPEMAFCDLDGNMNLAEEFLKEVIGDLLDNCGPDLDFFNQRIEPTLLATLKHVTESAFERLTYTEAIKLLESSGEKFEYPVFWGCDLQSEHERWLTETKIGRGLTRPAWASIAKSSESEAMGCIEAVICLRRSSCSLGTPYA